MASDKISKNSKKGSIVKEKRVEPKNEFILVEITQEVFDKVKKDQDLSTYEDLEIESIVSRYGKKYLKIKR